MARMRGTVVLLHGWMMNGDSMLPWSLQLAESGYRVVTLDLRNHGQSGTGPKAGGPNYLPRFCAERVTSTDTTSSGGNATLLSLEDVGF